MFTGLPFGPMIKTHRANVEDTVSFLVRELGPHALRPSKMFTEGMNTSRIYLIKQMGHHLV